MNSIEMDFLCLALVFMGMITLLPMNKWGVVSKERLTFLACEMVFYVLVLVAWGYLPSLPGAFFGGMAIGHMLSLISMTPKEEIFVARVANLTANVGILILLMVRNW